MNFHILLNSHLITYSIFIIISFGELFPKKIFATLISFVLPLANVFKSHASLDKVLLRKKDIFASVLVLSAE